jgi:hypothetical protein
VIFFSKVWVSDEMVSLFIWLVMSIYFERFFDWLRNGSMCVTIVGTATDVEPRQGEAQHGHGRQLDRS